MSAGVRGQGSGVGGQASACLLRPPNPQPQTHNPRPGFALLIAVFMIAMVGTASVALMTLLRDDAARTVPAADEAQLRQLLIAGAMAAPQLLPPPLSEASDRGQGRTQELMLPPELAERGAAITLRSERGTGGVTWLIHVDARLGDDSASQTLTFARTARGWSAVEAKLKE